MVFSFIADQKPTSPEKLDTSNTATATTTNTNTNNTRTSVMASSTLKSHHQPLHNFPLQDLKWSMNHTSSSNHHHRSRTNSSHKSPHRDNNAPAESSDGCDGIVKTEKSEKRSKIFIRIRTKNSSNSKCTDDEDAVADTGDHTSSVVMDDAEETLTKTWNLRPRKAVTKAQPNTNNNNTNHGNNGLKIVGAVAQDIKNHEPSRAELTRSQRNGNSNDNKVLDAEKKEKEKGKKMKFSIPLTKEEIEEDVYALTGSKPARRPKKRAKHVQKQLDFMFPGLWLASITPDVYRVPDAPPRA